MAIVLAVGMVAGLGLCPNTASAKRKGCAIFMQQCGGEAGCKVAENIPEGNKVPVERTLKSEEKIFVVYSCDDRQPFEVRPKVNGNEILFTNGRHLLEITAAGTYAFERCGKWTQAWTLKVEKELSLEEKLANIEAEVTALERQLREKQTEAVGVASTRAGEIEGQVRALEMKLQQRKTELERIQGEVDRLTKAAVPPPDPDPKPATSDDNELNWLMTGSFGGFVGTTGMFGASLRVLWLANGFDNDMDHWGFGLGGRGIWIRNPHKAVIVKRDVYTTTDSFGGAFVAMGFWRNPDFMVGFGLTGFGGGKEYQGPSNTRNPQTDDHWFIAGGVEGYWFPGDQKHFGLSLSLEGGGLPGLTEHIGGGDTIKFFNGAFGVNFIW